MQIVGGYSFGECRITIYYNPFDTQRIVSYDYYQENDPAVQILEESEIKQDVNKDHVKFIDGYHKKFNLYLMDKDIPTNQASILGFFYAYNRNTYKDKRILLYEKFDNSSESNWENVQAFMQNWVLVEGYPERVNIVKNNDIIGQAIKLKCITKDLISSDDIKPVVYRNINTGVWGSVGGPTRGTSYPPKGVA